MPWCNSDRLTAVKRLRPENENIFFPGVAEGDLNIFGLGDNLISSVSNVQGKSEVNNGEWHNRCRTSRVHFSPKSGTVQSASESFDTWDPFQLNPIGAEKESKRTCFQVAQYLVAAFVGIAVLTSAVIAKICLIECLVSLGTSVLVLVVMPQFDVLTNLFISGGVCIVSAILQIVFRLQRETWKIIFPVCSLILTVAGYCLLGIDYYVRVTSFVDTQNQDCYIYIGIGIFSSLLISLCWWENTMQATNRMQETLSNLDGYRDFVFVISSILRIIVIGGVYVLYHWFIEKSIKWDDFNLGKDDWELLQIGLVVLFLQAFCSAACHWFGVVACKIHAVRMSFALPVCCTGPAVLLLGLVLFLTEAEKLDGAHHGNITEFCESLRYLSEKNSTPVVLLELTKSICRTSLNSYYLQWPFSMLALEGVCMWSGFVTCTYYVWKIKVQRIERTSQLFVRRLYESAFIDLSLLLNTKMKVPRARNQERLDRYRGDPHQEHNDCFDFECHIFVDDAYMTDEETNQRLVNSYVDDLTQVVIEVYRVFTNKEPDDVSIIETPYGGRLMFVMPEGNMLYFHLKDKSLIRNKKRWSQRHNNPCRASLISMDGESYLLPQYSNDDKRKSISDDHTYILALDGDTDFQPKAVILLVDRLRMYYNVGAACGRIHPTGMGPMVWYQKFEYAVGHWLQKTAEHVFGSVLCSPGCFSLFRGSALMDDNVLKRYTTTATQASEYVQYDQGEDRWLCTLLLQQGWRVEYNAASDAYTNSPQEFKEFYNQRKRWGPSTLANTLDLLHSGAETVKRNMSVSRLYILYQMFTVGSSILGPASVTLMIAGAFQFVFKLDGELSIIVASIPPVFYIILCFITKTNTQITIAAIMSILYAFLMTASFFSIIGDMVIQGYFPDPHWLVFDFYVNHVFGDSFTTPRGVRGGAEVKKMNNVLCKRDCQLCCWDMKIEVSQETENLMIQKITGQTAQLALLNSITTEETTQQADAKLEPQAKVDTTKQEVVFEKGDKKPETDKPERKSRKGKDVAYSDTYSLRNTDDDDVCEDLVQMLTDTLNRELIGVGPETILSKSQLESLQSALEQQARHTLKTNHMERLLKRVRRAIDKTLTAPKVQKLDEAEDDFWNKLIDRYLEPITQTKEHKERISKELKSLRNKAVFLYFIINVLWVVATFFLQAIGSDIISIKIPKYYANGTLSDEPLKVEPLSLMFLLSFAVLLIIQFLAMLYHRIYTLIHVVSYRSTEKDYKPKEEPGVAQVSPKKTYAVSKLASSTCVTRYY
ncbi:Hyaluronan synthase 3 [Collichthys lucidus]|uniref:chitin synthase n=1 Tax=Collichthys lucidus TaxID=240159 RepID=A0A4U5U6V9_COLLU|nr:Hyaluronan synthase 3 [Collichthys lucidus]